MTDIVKKDVITISQVKAILESVKQDDMDQIQRWTYDYVGKFVKVKPSDAEKMTNQLVEKCDLTQEEAVEVTNVMPASLEELRAFTFGWKKLIMTETLEKILKILKSTES